MLIKSRLQSSFPLLSTAKSAEMWAHTRQPGSSLGHHLHFDTDEASLRLDSSAVRFPIASCVLYLTGEGGATVVFDQTPESKEVAERAWRVEPRVNKVRPLVRGGAHATFQQR